MEEGETRNAVKQGHDRGVLIEVLLRGMPRLQRATGHLKHLGRVTLRHPLAFQVTILRKQVSAFEAIPALVAILIAPVRLLDDDSHSDLLLKPQSW